MTSQMFDGITELGIEHQVLWGVVMHKKAWS